MEVNLVVFKPDGTRREAPLQPGTYMVGRDQDATLRIPLKSVSRSHCELVVTDASVSVRDLGSTNGTIVNGERVERALLRAGDVLTVGGVQLVFQIDGRPAQVHRPEPDMGLDLDLDDTPPGGLSMAKKKKPILGGSGASDESSMMGNSDITRGAGDPGDSDGSSAFDFDFDFPDDEKA